MTSTLAICGLYVLVAAAGFGHSAGQGVLSTSAFAVHKLGAVALFVLAWFAARDLAPSWPLAWPAAWPLGAALALFAASALALLASGAVAAVGRPEALLPAARLVHNTSAVLFAAAALAAAWLARR